MNPDKIGKFIKEKRQSINLSQQELADKIHVTRQAISGWENGRSCPDSDLLLTLSSLFNVSINEILSGGETDNSIEKVTLELVDDNIRKTSKIKRQVIIYTTTIFILVFLFLAYYFINNYNSIKVYKIAGTSDSLKMRDGIMVKTQNSIYLKLGQLYSNGKLLDAKSIEVYYLNNNKKIILAKNNQNDTTYNLLESYNNIDNNISIRDVIQNLYLEIKHLDDTKEIIHLKVRERYNNKFNIISAQPALSNNKKSIFITNNQLITNIKEILKSKPTKEIIIEKEENKEQVETISINNEETTPTQEMHNEDIMDYVKIIEQIKEKGTVVANIYQIEIVEEDRYISISTTDNQIMIDVMIGNILEQWTNNIIDSNEFKYTKMENFIITEQFIVNVDSMDENQNIKYNEMNNYLKMI